MRGAFLLLGLAGCNFVFGLDPTVKEPPPPPDVDHDGVADDDDNCLTTANADQTESDGDPFGDACDLCPGLATPTNHDEDGDLRGDECDGCPTVPNFPGNTDGDGIEDACDFVPANGPLNYPVLFDPFLTLRTDWTTVGTPWAEVGDAIVPTALPAVDDPGLVQTAITLQGDRAWEIRFGLTSTEPWSAGDHFGLAMIDPTTGARIASCELVCDTDCKLTLHTPDGATSYPAFITPSPVVEFRFNYYPNSLNCVIGTPGATAGGLLPTVRPVLLGNNKVQIRYFNAAQ